MDILWYLSQVDLFKTLSKSEKALIQSFTVTSDYPKATVIQAPHDKSSGIFFIKEGVLKIYNVNKNGKQVIAGIIGKGHTFGNTSLFSLGTRNHFIESITNVKICKIDQPMLELFLLERPKFLLELIKELNVKIDEQYQLLESLMLGDIRTKTLFVLTYLATHFGVKEDNFIRINFAFSHQDLANMIGATRESVSVVLSELTSEGIVKHSRLKIAIKANIVNKEI